MSDLVSVCQFAHIVSCVLNLRTVRGTSLEPPFASTHVRYSTSHHLNGNWMARFRFRMWKHRAPRNGRCEMR